jgi:hypothetical protein
MRELLFYFIGNEQFPIKQAIFFCFKQKKLPLYDMFHRKAAALVTLNKLPNFYKLGATLSIVTFVSINVNV